MTPTPMTPDELRKLDEELCAVLEGDHSGAQIAYLRRAIAGYADAWEHEHADRLKWVEAYNEVHLKWSEALRRLEAAEKAWADFKEYYPWTIQPYDDMQMTPEAVAALERLSAALAGEETK